MLGDGETGGERRRWRCWPGRAGAVSDDGTVDNGRGLAAVPAVRALPGAALQARNVALGLAEPDGTISAAPTERKPDEISATTPMP
jgi:hypothetical protein